MPVSGLELVKWGEVGNFDPLAANRAFPTAPGRSQFLKRVTSATVAAREPTR